MQPEGAARVGHAAPRPMRRGAAIALYLLALSACSPLFPNGPENRGAAPASPPTPAASPTAFAPLPGETALPAGHDGALRFETYNIQFGAGYTRRLDRVMEVMRAHQPDILALQELNRWSVGDPSRIALVAQDLGMQFVFCDSNTVVGNDPDNSFDTAVLSHFEILDSESYPQVSHCLARAELRLPDGSSMQVFSLHFRPNFEQSGCRNPEKMLEITAPYLNQNTVLLGDFNLPGPSGGSLDFLPIQTECAQRIEAAGWTLIAQNVIEIDQLWVSPALLGRQFRPYPGPQRDPLLSFQALATASDHFPLAVDMIFP